MAHGWANLISGAVGGVQNYLCYSNSALFYKCGGGEGFPDILRQAGSGGQENVDIVKQKLSLGYAMHQQEGGGNLASAGSSPGLPAEVGRSSSHVMKPEDLLQHMRTPDLNAASAGRLASLQAGNRMTQSAG